jgi:FAD/FMN-containing dehydrogenase
MTTTSQPTQTIDLDALRARVHGRVLAPGDEGYDAARVVALGGIDRHPAVIVRVADTDDVREVLAFARATGLDLAVRAGGHSAAAHSVNEGGIVLDVRDLTGLEIDTDGLTAWAGAGLSAGAYTTAVGEHGLVTGFGDTGSVGISGITLGGGVGYLTRKHGLTIDMLEGAEIVTADGAVHVVDADHEPDLFWGIRGGAGNLGVVTRLHFRLFALPQIVGGMLIQPATPEALDAMVRALDAAPEELSGILNVMPCPPMPFVPPTLHGSLVMMLIACWSGPVEEADAALAPLRAVATPIADLLGPKPYAALYPPEQPDYHPLAVNRTLFLDSFDRTQAKLTIDRLASSDSPMRVAQVRVLGGAASRVPVDATAYAHRERRFMLNVATFYEGPDDRDAKLAWAKAFARDLGPAPGAYVNFIGDEGPDRVRDAWPGATWDRLAALKRRYDPGNLFRGTQNVPPAPNAG